MKPTGTKIIIKPPRAAGGSSGSPGAGPSRTLDRQEEEEDSPASPPYFSTAPHSPAYSGDAPETPRDSGDYSAGEEVVTALQPIPVPEVRTGPRPRGRPKGSGNRGGRGAGPAVPPRPRGRPKGSKTVRGRGRGRGAKAAPPPRKLDEDGNPLEGENDDDDADSRARAGPQKNVRGKIYYYEGDELVTPEDPKGNMKIDEFGNLLGGRRYKAPSFVLPNRDPNRVYMLAIDAARTSGFRDSLYYFRRNPLAHKLNATQIEKDHLIEIGKLGSHLKTRSVTLITARSAFKLHGSKMIIDGRWVEDDYYEDQMMAEVLSKGLTPGASVGELPDPAMYSNEAQALRIGAAGGLGKNDPIRTSSIYRAGGPTTLFGGSGWGPFSDGPHNAVRKSLLSRDGLTPENWMAVTAMRVAEQDHEWAKQRKSALAITGMMMEGQKLQGDPNEKRRRRRDDGTPLGVYEPHSGLVYLRSDTQPTISRWEEMPDSAEKRVLGGTKVGNAAFGVAWVDTVLELPQEDSTDDDIVIPAAAEAYSQAATPSQRGSVMPSDSRDTVPMDTA